MLLVAAEVEHKDAMEILIEYKGKMKDDNTWHLQNNMSFIKAATNSHTKAGDTQGHYREMTVRLLSCLLSVNARQTSSGSFSASQMGYRIILT